MRGHPAPGVDVTRVGHWIYVFQIAPHGGAADDDRRPADRLAGCLKEFEPAHLIDAP